MLIKIFLGFLFLPLLISLWVLMISLSMYLLGIKNDSLLKWKYITNNKKGNENE